MSASDATQEFAEDILGRDVGAEDTADRYSRWALRFEAWKPAGEPSADMLRDFDSFLQDEDRIDYPWENARGRPAPASYAYQTRISALSGVKLWAEYSYDQRIEKEVQNLSKGEPAPFEPTVLDPGTIETVIQTAPAACDNPECQVAIRVGYDAIMRGAELADVRAEDVNPEDRSLYVRAKKGSEPTNIVLGNQAWSALKRHYDTHQDRDFLFRNSYGRAWTAAAWNQHFRRKHHEAGFHAFARHSAVSNRLKAGEDFGDVFLRARHSQPQTTLKYVEQAGADAPDWANR